MASGNENTQPPPCAIISCLRGSTGQHLEGTPFPVPFPSVVVPVLRGSLWEGVCVCVWGGVGTLLPCRGRYWHLLPGVGQDAELPQGVGQSGTINGPSPNARGIPGKKPLVPQECETMDCLSRGLLAQCGLRQRPQEQALPFMIWPRPPYPVFLGHRGPAIPRRNLRLVLRDHLSHLSNSDPLKMLFSPPETLPFHPPNLPPGP